MKTTVVPKHSIGRLTGCLVVSGLPGIPSLLFQHMPESLMQQHPAVTEMPLWLFKLLGLLNPLVLLVLAALLGAVLAHWVGLHSVLAGTAISGDMRRSWWLAAGTGLATGMLVVMLDIAAAPLIGDPWSSFLWQTSRPDLQVLIIGVLYGGITEEILMRWGLMSLLAWALWTLSGKKHLSQAIVVAIVATALIFGAFHLPALGTQVELTTGIVLRTVLINALAAVVYGWVYWRHHLEAAMLSHACSHLAMATVWSLL